MPIPHLIHHLCCKLRNCRLPHSAVTPSDHRSAIKVPFYIGRLVVATRSDAKWPSGSSGWSGSHPNVVAYKWFPCQCQVNTVTGGVDRGAI